MSRTQHTPGVRSSSPGNSEKNTSRTVNPADRTKGRTDAGNPALNSGKEKTKKSGSKKRKQERS